MTLNIEKLRSPQWIFIIYIILTGLLIILFRFIFPGSEAPLLLYSRSWRVTQGFLEFFNWYPALALAALVVPFGFVTFEENYQSFSDVFFKRLLVSVITAICAAVIYGLIFFLILPLVRNSEDNMLYNGELYQLSKNYAYEHRSSGEWVEASQFLAICDFIWLNSPELADLKVDIEINLDKKRLEETRERNLARTALTRDLREPAISANFSSVADRQPVLTVVQAVNMGTLAYNEKHYYEAHWLFTLGSRLAETGSAEERNCTRLASDAWNMISSQEPNLMEARLYRLFQLKNSGYQAMNTGEWIRAYYIFQELLAYTPDDPDAVNFLALSELGSKETAFFIDEMELSLGEILTGAVFSLPDDRGRAILRFSSLTTSEDIAYGMGFEYMSFDEESRLTGSARSRYAKLLPFILNGKQQVLILTHALDRYDESNNFDSEWLYGDKPVGGVFLDISFDDLMLLSDIRRGLHDLQISELFAAAQKFTDTGYVYQIFQAEILNRIGSALFFLPAAIFIIIIGWRYRVKMKPRYLFAVMLPVLPVIFHGFVFIYRSILNNLGIWLVLSMGFMSALAVYIVVMAILLIVALIALSAQHG
ncbi:MAG: hypothetical protein FWC19_04560 [Treponema sp.]|nr:hypothetical protein [Treponema sp.]MCL2272062.1 hypothetical protein [Treponema sp.]